MTYLEEQAARDVDRAAGKHPDRAAHKARKVLLDLESDRLAREVARAGEALMRLDLQHAQRPLPPARYDADRTELESQVTQLVDVLE